MHIADFQRAVMLWMEQCFGRATDGAKKGIRNCKHAGRECTGFDYHKESGIE